MCGHCRTVTPGLHLSAIGQQAEAARHNIALHSRENPLGMTNAVHIANHLANSRRALAAGNSDRGPKLRGELQVALVFPALEPGTGAGRGDDGRDRETDVDADHGGVTSQLWSPRSLRLARSMNTGKSRRSTSYACGA